MPLFCGFFLVNNTYAESLSVSSFGLYGQKTYGSANSWQSNLSYSGTNMHSVFKWEVWSRSLSAQETGKYASIGLSGLINIPSDFTVATSQGFTVEQCVVGTTSAALSEIHTAWAVNNATATSPPQIIWSATALLEFPTNDISGQMYCTLRSNGGLYFLQHSTTGVGVVSFGTTNFNVTFNNNLSDELLQQQINQNNTIIDQNQTIINQNQEQIDKENASVDNIENQSPDDYSDTENQATTNIIGVISSFFAQFTNFTPTNCEVTLPFPDFFGGSMTQNICSGKEQAGEIISIVGSLIMVGFYIPLAFALLKMIYSEIRSFTNG